MHPWMPWQGITGWLQICSTIVIGWLESWKDINHCPASWEVAMPHFLEGT